MNRQRTHAIVAMGFAAGIVANAAIVAVIVMRLVGVMS
jgi:hypothetical protein